MLRLGLAVLACGGCPAAGLKLGGVELDTVNQALRKLDSFWPGRGVDVVTAATTRVRNSPEKGIPLQNKLRDVMNAKRPFVFAAFGSSVSAGHDNVFNQSWPFELERLLKPTFQSLGFDFETRQRAAGGYGEMPFAAGCLRARAGDGVDALSWEWGMFNDPACEGHHFLSEAYDMPSKPVVFALADVNLNYDNALMADKNSRQGMRRQFLQNNDEHEFGNERVWRPNEWYLSTDFVSNDEVETWRSKSGIGPELREGEHGQQMHYLQFTGAAAPFEADGMGFYPVAVSQADPFVLGDPWYQTREKAFNINWHPGPLGHTLIATQIAHYILTQLREVVRSSNMRSAGPTADNPLVGRKPIRQENICPRGYSDVTGGQYHFWTCGMSCPGGAYTDDTCNCACQPTVHELRCGHLTSQQCFTGMAPHSNAGLESLVSDKNHEWSFEVSKQAAQVHKLGESVDTRMVFRGTKDSGELKFRVKTTRDGQYAMFCGAPCGWWCQQPSGYVASRSQRWWNGDTFKGLPVDDPRSDRVKDITSRGSRGQWSDLTYAVDGNITSDEDLVRMHEELFGEQGAYCPNCANPADLCQPVAKLPKGFHTLSVRVNPRTFDTETFPETWVELFQVMVIG